MTAMNERARGRLAGCASSASSPTTCSRPSSTPRWNGWDDPVMAIDVDADRDATVAADLAATVHRERDRPALHGCGDRTWTTVSWRDLGTRVRHVANLRVALRSAGCPVLVVWDGP